MLTINIIISVFVLTTTNGASVPGDVDSNGCILPKHPVNGRWLISSGPNRKPGEKVQNSVVLNVTCDSLFKLKGSSVLTCNSGNWSAEVGQCFTCGVKSVQAQTLIVNGNNIEQSDYPWQVALYKIGDSQKNLICGGTLIDQRVILTAAHCVTNAEGEKLPHEDYIIAVGKYYRNFDDPRDKTSKFSKLKEIIVPSEYRGAFQNYIGDIAILISESLFDITREIQPICLDWEAEYESEFLKPNNTGFVAGWGFTQENQSPSEVLKDLEVPYIDTQQCQKDLPPDFEIFLTDDKMCSGFLQKGKSICNGDGGGGLIFKNKNDNKYYLAGVVSLTSQSPTGGCDSQQYALYTRVSTYIKKFILETVRLYSN